MPTLLPINFPRFHLRCDFAEELGFIDHCRAPLPAEKAPAALKASGNPTFSWISLRLLNRDRECYRPPRYFGYLGGIPPKETAATALVWDGRTWLVVPQEGLWEDLISRIRAAIGVGEDSAVPIYPTVPKEPLLNWLLADRVALHDTEESVATVVPYALAKPILQMAW